MELFSEKVLIIAQGVERERILASTCYHSPTKLVILRNTNDVEALRKQIKDTLKQVQSDLGTKSPDGIPLFPLLREMCLNESCNFFDLSECVAKVDSLIKAEKKKGARVVIDVSSGPKIVGIAMYIAAVLNQVPVTYFIAGKYANSMELPKRYTFSVKRSQVVPTLPLILKDVPFSTLKRLDSVGGYVESVTALAGSQDKGLIVKISRQLRTLEALGYVMRIGRSYKITGEGKDFLKLEEVVY